MRRSFHNPLAVFLIVAACAASAQLSWAQSTAAQQSLTGDWAYYGGIGRAKIRQSGQNVAMELTWTQNSAPGPHYKIDATRTGNTLTGTWKCVTPACQTQNGKFHADVNAGGQIAVSQTDDPGGANEWNGLVLTRAPNTSSALASSLKASGVAEIYDIHFDVDSAAIKPESKAMLQQVAQLLKDDPSLKLMVSGHTDNTGTTAHNLTLSQARADAVVAALVKNYGIGAGRLKAKGYGDTRPIVPSDTYRNRANNRRVELRKL